MRELSLFTGAGGGLLGTKLLGWRHVGYVEIDDYCQRVIAQRIKDGILDDAPIFSDIRSFISEGYAERYCGVADVITAGFPCQPFSVAGKREGGADDRNMWPDTIAAIRAVRPRYVLLENVPGLSHVQRATVYRLALYGRIWGAVSGSLTRFPYAGRVLGELAESGYDCKWRILSAAEVGAPHKRDRFWIMCHANGRSDRKITRPSERQISAGRHEMGDAVSVG